MLKVVSSLCAAMMAVSLPFAAPAMAMPKVSPAIAINQASPLLVQDGQSGALPDRLLRRGNDRDWNRGDRDWNRGDRNWGRDRDRGENYWRGHRGYRNPRPGYRQRGDYWFPPAAFIAGAIVGGAIANQEPPIRYRPRGNAHVDWCFNRYRSYRASDNTYQPYNGPRRACNSPYG